METIYKLNDYLGSFDNIVGVLGLCIGIIGVVVGAIGALNIKFKYSKKAMKQTHVTNGNNQVADVINNNGVNVGEVEHIARNKDIEFLQQLTDSVEAPELIKDKRYKIAFSWTGTQKEYNELKRMDKIYDCVTYFIQESDTKINK